MSGEREEAGEIRRIEAVDRPDHPLVVEQDRQRRMGGGQPSDVLEPGRADRQTRDQVALGGECEEGLTLLARNQPSFCSST